MTVTDIFGLVLAFTGWLFLFSGAVYLAHAVWVDYRSGGFRAEIFFNALSSWVLFVLSFVPWFLVWYVATM